MPESVVTVSSGGALIEYGGCRYADACAAAGEALQRMGYRVVEVDLELGLVTGTRGSEVWLVCVSGLPDQHVGTIQLLPGRVADGAVQLFQTHLIAALTRRVKLSGVTAADATVRL